MCLSICFNLNERRKNKNLHEKYWRKYYKIRISKFFNFETTFPSVFYINIVEMIISTMEYTSELLIVGQIETGIKGLDLLLKGGFIKGTTVLLIGPVGTLKPHIGFQFLHTGLKSGERCFCLSTTQDLKIRSMQFRINYGWDLESYVKNGKLDFLYFSPIAVQSSTYKFVMSESGGSDIIREVIHRITGDVTRILIHTLSQLFKIINDEKLVLSLIYRLKELVRKNNAVAIFTVDSGIQNSSVEEEVKSICDYVLETREYQSKVEIRVLKSLTRHDLEWRRVYTMDDGVHIQQNLKTPVHYINNLD